MMVFQVEEYSILNSFWFEYLTVLVLVDSFFEDNVKVFLQVLKRFVKRRRTETAVVDFAE